MATWKRFPIEELEHGAWYIIVEDLCTLSAIPIILRWDSEQNGFYAYVGDKSFFTYEEATNPRTWGWYQMIWAKLLGEADSPDNLTNTSMFLFNTPNFSPGFPRIVPESCKETGYAITHTTKMGEDGKPDPNQFLTREETKKLKSF